VSPLLLSLLLSQATVYTWTDKAGVEHFTDIELRAPRREGAQHRGDEISSIDSDLNHNARPVAVAPVAPPTAAEPEVPSVSEQTWRQLFKDARRAWPCWKKHRCRPEERGGGQRAASDRALQLRHRLLWLPHGRDRDDGERGQSALPRAGRHHHR